MSPTTPQVAREKTGSATPTIPRGRFIWYELLANDEQVATTFYTKVFGWSTEPFQTAGQPPYTMLKMGGKSFGGVMKLPAEAKSEGAPSHWLGYVTVPDTDATLALAKKRGAELHIGPMDIPTVGRFAVIADPQGASICIFTPKPADPSSGEVAEGIVSWHELATNDWKKAFDFYQELFGWQKGESMDMGAAGIYQIFTYEGKPTGGIFNRPPQIPVPSWLYYFEVGNLEEAIDRTKANAGKILNGPMDVPGGRIAQCMDPQGGAFAVHRINR